MGVAVTAWTGWLTLVIAGFAGNLNEIQWNRVADGVMGIAVIASFAWMQVQFAVIPRTAYRLGVETGERNHKRREQEHQLLLFPAMKATNGHRAPSAR